jgi:hypothetical protein
MHKWRDVHKMEICIQMEKDVHKWRMSKVAVTVEMLLHYNQRFIWLTKVA